MGVGAVLGWVTFVAAAVAAQASDVEVVGHARIASAPVLARQLGHAYAALGMGELADARTIEGWILAEAPPGFVDRTAPCGAVLVARGEGAFEKLRFWTRAPDAGHADPALPFDAVLMEAGADDAAAAAREHVAAHALGRPAFSSGAIDWSVRPDAIARRAAPRIEALELVVRARAGIGSLLEALEPGDGEPGAARAPDVQTGAIRLLERIASQAQDWERWQGSARVDEDAIRVTGSLAPRPDSAPAWFVAALPDGADTRGDVLVDDADLSVRIAIDRDRYRALSGGAVFPLARAPQPDVEPSWPAGGATTPAAPIEVTATLPRLATLVARACGRPIAVPADAVPSSNGAVHLAAWRDGDELRYELTIPLAHLRASLPCWELP